MEEFINTVINTVIKETKFDDLEKISESDGFICDGSCKRDCKTIVDNGENLYNYVKLIYCETCYQNKDYQSLTKGLEYIDRRNFSTKEKPRYWRCDLCSTSLGGGCQWYCNSKTDIDICYECYHKDLSKEFKLLDKDVYICYRGIDGVYFKISEVKDLQIPEQLVDQIKEDNVKNWIQTFDSLANVNINHKIVNLCEWLPISDMYEMTHTDAFTQLLVNCGVEGNGQVASLVSDDHGRVSLDLIYDTLDKYLEDYKKWVESRLSGDELEKLQEKLEEDDDNIDEVAAACQEFSGYIRLHNRLSFYYG